MMQAHIRGERAAEEADSPTSAVAVDSFGAKCRFCANELRHSFVNLGMSPLCQTHITREQLNAMERFFPLHALVCDRCWLVQLQEYVAPADIFSEYAYFSSYSDSWVRHALKYVEDVSARYGIGRSSLVMEIASNDGYLLQHFVARHVPVLGIEPAANVAQVAIAKGVRSEVCFFGRETAQRIRKTYGAPDLLLGNNVLAHVPDLNDFVSGLKLLLADRGVITMEFPHLFRLIEDSQFDTIYHEHFSYFSFTTVSAVFAHHGLTLFDVEELPTHGGSLRIHARHSDDPAARLTERAAGLLAREERQGVRQLETYRRFGEQVREVKRGLLSFLIEAKRAGKRIVGYGAPGKGNTLLNYCGIGTDFLDFTVDRNPYKQGKFTPGAHIPILPPEQIEVARPDYVLILPWNLKEEIMQQAAIIRSWGGKFVVPIPEVAVL
jgi:C-methyltransferase C-terminal domain/Putative zinc binding domain/Methyltransferase domain